MFFRKLKAVLQRELRQMFARPIYIFSSVIVMVFSCIFFLTLMDEGMPQNLPVAIVDHDHSTISRRFAHELEATQMVSVVAEYPTYTDARKAMQRGEIYAFLEIPENLYADLLANRRPAIAFYSNNTYLVGGMLSYKQMMTMVNLASGAMQREVLRAKGMPEDKIMACIQPVLVDAHMIGNPWTNYPIYLLTTILPGILGLMILMLTVFSIGYELKMRTSKEWLATAGNSYTIALLGKLIPYTILFVVLGIGCNILMFRFMHFPMAGSLLFLSLGTIVYVLAMQAIGVTFIGLFPVLRSAVCVAALYGVLAFSLSGFTYPVPDMMPVVQAWSALFPLRHYYIITINEMLLGLPTLQSFIRLAVMLAFCLLPFTVAHRLKNALIYQNYPLD